MPVNDRSFPGHGHGARSPLVPGPASEWVLRPVRPPSHPVSVEHMFYGREGRGRDLIGGLAVPPSAEQRGEQAPAAPALPPVSAVQRRPNHLVLSRADWASDGVGRAADLPYRARRDCVLDGPRRMHGLPHRTRSCLAHGLTDYPAGKSMAISCITIGDAGSLPRGQAPAKAI